MERSSCERSEVTSLCSLERLLLDNVVGHGLARRMVCLHCRNRPGRTGKHRVCREVLRLCQGVRYQVLGLGFDFWMQTDKPKRKAQTPARTEKTNAACGVSQAEKARIRNWVGDTPRLGLPMKSVNWGDLMLVRGPFPDLERSESPKKVD